MWTRGVALTWTTPHPTNPNTDSFMRQTAVFLKPLLALALCTALLTCCNTPTTWDKEYTCTGQEQSNTVFKGADPAACH